jgi:hypothetical protein
MEAETASFHGESLICCHRGGMELCLRALIGASGAVLAITDSHHISFHIPITILPALQDRQH